MRRTATARVQTAHGDAWQVSGRLRVADGGGAAELPGVRLMSSGLPVAQWNAADVTDPALVDLDAVRAWFAARGAGGTGVPWGVHVPAGTSWPHGRHLFRKRLMSVVGPELSPAPAVEGLVLREARPDDLDAVTSIDATAFGDPVDRTRAWTAPYLGARGVVVLLASLEGEPVATATGLRSDGVAGPCVEVSAVGVLEQARGRGIGAALTSAVATWGFASGADMVWLGPEDDDAARLYGRLGFVETDGLDVYVDV